MHQVALELGPLTVHWYGVFVASGFMLGLWLATRRALLDQISPEIIADLGPWLIVGTILGARTLYVISYWDHFTGQPWTEIFAVHHGGLVFYGGFIGAIIAGTIYVRWKHLPFWRLADILAPSLALGQVFGRLGCLMNGCCFGKETDLPWAIHYPVGHETAGAGVHPAPIYESLLCLALYFGLAALFRAKRFHGQVAAAYLLGYGILRMIVENFRGDYHEFYLHRFTQGQFISFWIIASGLMVWRLRCYSAKDQPQASS